MNRLLAELIQGQRHSAGGGAALGYNPGAGFGIKKTLPQPRDCQKRPVAGGRRMRPGPAGGHPTRPRSRFYRAPIADPSSKGEWGGRVRRTAGSSRVAGPKPGTTTAIGRDWPCWECRPRRAGTAGRRFVGGVFSTNRGAGPISRSSPGTVGRGTGAASGQHSAGSGFRGHGNVDLRNRRASRTPRGSPSGSAQVPTRRLVGALRPRAEPSRGKSWRSCCRWLPLGP